MRFTLATTDDTGLTLTWDVLKYVISFSKFQSCTRLTLTWDVLKLVFRINNFRIESD